MTRVGRILAEFGAREQPLLHQHLDARRRWQIAEPVARTLRQDQVHFLQRIQHGEGVGLDGGVVVLLVERGAKPQEVVEGFEEL